MNKTKVIKYKNLPARLPFSQTLVTWMFIDYAEVNLMFSSVLWVIILLKWIVNVSKIMKTEYADVEFKVSGDGQ